MSRAHGILAPPPKVPHTMTAPQISTCLWFDTEAEAAARLYCSVLPDAHIRSVRRMDEPDGPALLVEFDLMGQQYVALNGGPQYRLTPAVSLQVFVETQAEVDRLWAALLDDGGQEGRCGWLTDRFGLSWQIVPNALPRLMAAGGAASERVMRAMFAMARLDIAALEAAAVAD